MPKAVAHLARMQARVVGHESRQGQAHRTRVGKVALPDKYWVFHIETRLGQEVCTATRRYSEFVRLHKAISATSGGAAAPLPTKRRTKYAARQLEPAQPRSSS